MSDLIERQKALDAIQQRADRVDSVYSAFWEGLIIAQNIVAKLPPAEPERKTGEWKTVAFLTAECSECGAQVHELEYNNYCPNCGVNMRGDNGEA